MWAIKGSKPIILTTGSKRKVILFGALGEDRKQLFRQYKTADSDAFLDYLKLLKRKWPKMLLFLDKAPWHKEKRVKSFLRKHKDSIRVFWFPTANPEANPVEECWNQGKDEVLGSTFYHSFNDFRNAIIKCSIKEIENLKQYIPLLNKFHYVGIDNTPLTSDNHRFFMIGADF